MSNEQTDHISQNIDPRLSDEISVKWDINRLRRDPAIACEDLFSSNKMGSAEYPDKLGVRIALGTPIETAVSSRSDVEQDLMAVIALGQSVGLGIVRGKDKSGNEVNYVSLLNNNLSDNDGRARLVGVLRKDTPFTITRARIEQVVDREETVPGVSAKHCTIELQDGVLTVVDETSTNGTSVFTNTTQEPAAQFHRIQVWAQRSQDTEKLIKDEEENKKSSRASRLGRFTVNS